jgi:hypothetical protein
MSISDALGRDAIIRAARLESLHQRRNMVLRGLMALPVVG